MDKIYAGNVESPTADHINQKPPTKMRRHIKTINHPVIRSSHHAHLVRQMGLVGDTAYAMRLALTPRRLLEVPDHASRGQKSLGRIQQLTNRRRFKVRPRISN